MSEDFCKRIRFLMRKSGFTQAKLADRIGITETTMSRYVNGERVPNAIVLAEIAKALHCTSDMLLGIDSAIEDSDLAFNVVLNNVVANKDKFTIDQKTAILGALFVQEGK